jgi:hypothetical protein
MIEEKNPNKVLSNLPPVLLREKSLIEPIVKNPFNLRATMLRISRKQILKKDIKFLLYLKKERKKRIISFFF